MWADFYTVVTIFAHLLIPDNNIMLDRKCAYWAFLDTFSTIIAFVDGIGIMAVVTVEITTL
jgi:hypothetical protein